MRAPCGCLNTEYEGMNFEPDVVLGIIAVMSSFTLILGGVSLYSRGGKR